MVQMGRDLPESFADEDSPTSATLSPRSSCGHCPKVSRVVKRSRTILPKVASVLENGSTQALRSRTSLSWAMHKKSSFVSRTAQRWYLSMTPHWTITYAAVSLPRTSASVGCGVSWRTPVFARGSGYTCNRFRYLQTLLSLDSIVSVMFCDRELRPTCKRLD